MHGPVAGFGIGQLRDEWQVLLRGLLPGLVASEGGVVGGPLLHRERDRRRPPPGVRIGHRGAAPWASGDLLGIEFHVVSLAETTPEEKEDDTVTVAMTSPERSLLTDDELRLLSLLAEGLPMEAVARRLDMSDRTVRRRVRALCDRIGVKSPIQAVVWAARKRLI